MRLNYRFLAVVFGILAILGASVFVIHWIQSENMHETFLRRAKAAEADGRLGDALGLYRRYVSLSPDAHEARAALGRLYFRSGAFEPALKNLETALRLSDGDNEVRKTLVELNIQMGRFADAVDHLSALLSSSPDNPDLLKQLARCEEELASFEDAKKHLSRVIEIAPSDADAGLSLANLLTRRLNSPDLAQQILDQLIEADPSKAASYLARSRWLFEQASSAVVSENAIARKLIERSWGDVKQALALEKNSPNAVQHAVDVATALERSSEARPLVEEAIAANPNEARLYLSAGKLELSAEDIQAAIAVLRRGLRECPGNVELVWNLAQLQIATGDFELADQLVNNRAGMELPALYVKYLQAILLSERGSWRDAAVLLEEVRAQLARSDELIKQVDYLLSICYGNTGNFDQQLVALRRTVSSDPLWLIARESLANALVRSGRSKEALNEFWQVAQLPNPPDSALLSLSRLLLIDGLRNGVDQNDWGPFERALDLLEEAKVSPDETVVLRAELLVARDQDDAARTLLQEFIAKDPKATRCYLALVALDIRDGKWEEAEAGLVRAEENLGDSAALRLERARLILRRDVQKVNRDQLEALAEEGESWDEVDVAQLKATIASQFMSMEDYPRAERLAREVAESKIGDRNLAIHLLLFDLTFQSRNLEAMTKTLDRVKQIEGAGPLWMVGTAVKQIVEAQTAGNEGAYSEALRNLNEAAVIRPTWSRIPAIKAEVYSLQNLEDQAIGAYMEAINLGERNPQLVSKTILKLFQSGRFREADELVRKLQEQQTPFSSQLMRVASEVSLQLEEFDRALSLAQEWARDSDSIEDHLWLAQVYGITGDTEAAVASFQTAIDMAPAEPAAWVSLAQLYARIGDRESVIATVARADKNIAPELKNDAIAQCFEAIFDLKQAEENYLLALKARPKSAPLLRRVADCYLRSGRDKEAEQFLDQLVEPASEAGEEERSWARRNLTLVLGLSGNQQNVARALKLIDENLLLAPNSLDDRRVKAVVLGNRPEKEYTLQAMKILEAVVREQRTFSLSDNFLLAELYRRADDWSRYSRTMRAVLGNGGAVESRYLLNYAEALLEKGEIAEAQLWFERLRQIAPGDLSTATIETELVFQSQDYTRAQQLLTENSQKPNGLLWAAETAEVFGVKLGELSKSSEAEAFMRIADDCYRQLVEQDPSAKWSRAKFLARQGRVSEAIDGLELSDDATRTGIAEMVQSALVAGRLTRDDSEKLVKLLDALQNAGWLTGEAKISFADLYSWRGEWENAMGLYLEVLQSEPQNIIALNNLAMVLGLSGKELPVAQKAIDMAIKISGPHHYLLDTQAIVLLAADQPQAALQSLTLAIEAQPNPNLQFHLALVLMKLNRLDDARQAFQLARDGGVNEKSIHPLEQPMYSRLNGLL